MSISTMTNFMHILLKILFAVFFAADRNKQRHKIQRRIREDKKKLFNAISQYNTIFQTLQNL